MGDERIHRVVSDDGTEIAGRVEGQGPPLVLWHGRLEDGDSCWKALLPLLTDRFTCFTPSTRGRGLSGDASDHAPDRLVEDATAFIDSIGEPVAVTGWSSGAGLTLAALARSTAISAAAVYEPSVTEVLGEQDAAWMKAAFAEVADFVEDGRLAEAGRRFVAAVATDEEFATATEAGLGEVWASYARLAHEESQQTHLTPSDHPKPTDPSMLERISSPLLVLHGDQTPLRWLADGARYIAEHVPTAEVRRLAGVGHLAPVVAPRAVADELVPFFEAVWEMV